MAIEIVSLPMNHADFPKLCYVSLPEGTVTDMYKCIYTVYIYIDIYIYIYIIYIYIYTYVHIHIHL